MLHTAFEAQEVRARTAAEPARAALAALTARGQCAGERCTGCSQCGAVQQQRCSAPRGRAAGCGARGRRGRGRAGPSTARRSRTRSGPATNAALNYLADKAGYSRVGHHGGAAGRWIDAHDWTVASFFQHDSRDHDPQLHIHNAILNRVQGPDGKWRTLDAKAIAQVPRRRVRGRRARDGTAPDPRLGVQFAMRPDGKAREVVGIDQAVMDLFSSRRRAITRKTAAAGGGVRDEVRPGAERAGAGPAAAAGDVRDPQGQVARRRDRRGAARSLGRRSCAPRSRGGLAEVADDVLDLGRSGRGGRAVVEPPR